MKSYNYVIDLPECGTSEVAHAVSKNIPSSAGEFSLSQTGGPCLHLRSQFPLGAKTITYNGNKIAYIKFWGSQEVNIGDTYRVAIAVSKGKTYSTTNNKKDKDSRITTAMVSFKDDSSTSSTNADVISFLLRHGMRVLKKNNGHNNIILSPMKTVRINRSKGDFEIRNTFHIEAAVELLDGFAGLHHSIGERGSYGYGQVEIVEEAI